MKRSWLSMRYSRHYYFKLFITLTFLITMIISILTLVLYQNFKAYTLKTVNYSNQKLTNQVFEYALLINDQVKSYVSSQFSHPDVAQLMYGVDIPVLDTIRTIRALDASLGNFPFIHSVYIYNGRTDTYYSIGSNPSYRQGQIFDSDITKRLQQERFSNTLVPIPRKIPVSELKPDKEINVYTYIMDERFLTANNLKNALMVNVYADWIFNLLLSQGKTDLPNAASMMIIDQDGTIIGHSDHQQFLKSVSEEPYIQTILQASEKSGYFLDNVDGAPTVITYSTYDKPAWTFLTLTPYSSLSDQMNYVKNITIVIGLITFIIFLLSAYWLARILYSPIRGLHEKVRNKPVQIPAKDPRNLNEFEYLTRFLDSTDNQLKSLESFKKSNMDTLKQQYLKHLLHKTNKNTDLFTDRAKEYPMKLNLRNEMMIILFKVDKYAEFRAAYERSDQSLYRYALTNIIDEIMSPIFICETVDLGDDQVIAIINTGEDSEQAHAHLDNGSIQRLVLEIQQIYSHYFSLSISVFVSPPGVGLEALPEIYSKTKELANYRLLYGHGCLLTDSEFNLLKVTAFSDEHATVTKLIDAIKYAKLTEIKQHYDTLISEIRNYDYNSVMYMLSFLSSSIFNTLNIMEHNSTLTFNFDYATFDKALKSLETMDEINESFYLLFESILDCMQQNKNDRPDITVNTAMAYIRNTYMDHALSSAQVADTVELTSAYLGKLFREHTTMSISEYITKVRIDHAKTLLQNPELTIDDILIQIGWENKKYFYTIFKRREGVTPSEFRAKETQRNSAIS